MERYRTIKPIFLYSGQIGLDENQARPRLETGRIKQTETDGVYDISGEVCFKAGEIVGLAVKDLATLQKLEFLDADDEQKADDEPDQTTVVKKPGRQKK